MLDKETEKKKNPNLKGFSNYIVMEGDLVPTITTTV